MAQCWRGPTLRSPEARPGTRKMRRSTAIDAVNVTFSCWTTRKSNRSNNKTIRYPRSCTSKTQFYDVQILPWGFNVVKTCEIKHRWIYQRVDCMSAQMAAYYWIYHWIWMRRYHPLLVSNHFASPPNIFDRLKQTEAQGFTRFLPMKLCFRGGCKGSATPPSRAQRGRDPRALSGGPSDGPSDGPMGPVGW